MYYRPLLVIIWPTRYVLKQESTYTDRPLDLLNGGNSGSESDVTVDVAGVSSTVAGVDVDHREGSDSDEGGDMSPTFDDGDGNDWNFLNLALCLCLKVSKKWSPGEGL